MQTHAIWKFALEHTDQQFVQLPRGAKILSAQVQRERICLWALCDPEGETAARDIRMFGTGHSVPDWDSLTFIDTVQLMGGNLVLHVFELVKHG